jgi:hypothetical protein
MLKLEFVPEWPDGTVPDGAEIVEVLIVENGTEAGLPAVIFKNIYGGHFTLTGRYVNAISATIKGSNMRRHGNPEP